MRVINYNSDNCKTIFRLNLWEPYPSHQIAISLLQKILFILVHLVVFLLISNINIRAFAAADEGFDLINQAPFVYQQPEIPARFDSKIEEYLFYDNNFNVIQRLKTAEKAKNNLMSELDKQPVKVLIFEASIEKIKESIYVSQYVNQQDLIKVQVGNDKIYIPCLESDTLGINALKAKLGAPVYTTTGRKVLSRATYYIEPIGPTGGFFAKFVPHVPGLDQKLEREVLVNDYIKSQLSKLPEEMKNLSMDSFMAVNLSFLGIPVAVAYRSAERILDEKSQDSKIYPGHGLLGCDACLEKYAKLSTGLNDSDKAVDRWKTEELLPKLARYLAYAHHILGVSFEAHTQNMIFEIDIRTGKIKNIYMRDFADVLLNPIPLLAENRFPSNINWERVKLLSIHPHYFSDQGVQVAKDIWYHASIYSGQGITSHLKGFKRQQRHLAIFLKSYIAETEAILGEKISLDQSSHKVLQSLEDRVSKKDFDSGELQERSALRNAMASILKPVFEFSHRLKIGNIKKELENAEVNIDEAKLKETFFDAVKTQRVIFMGVSERELVLGADTKSTWFKSTVQAYLKIALNRSAKTESFEYKILNQRLWLVDRQSQKPLAVVIDSYKGEEIGAREEKKGINFKSNIKNPIMSVQCKNLFSRGSAL